MKKMEQVMVDDVIKELIKRAYEAFKKHGTCTTIDKLFKCPKCGRKHFEYKFKGELNCLWADCALRISAPTFKELDNFFKQERYMKRNKRINDFFQEIMKENDNSLKWEDVFVFT